MSGLNWFGIASSGDSASVKLLCSVAQPVIRGGTVSHFMFVGPCIVNVLHDHPYYHVNPDILSTVRDPLPGNGCGSPNHTCI